MRRMTLTHDDERQAEPGRRGVQGADFLVEEVARFAFEISELYRFSGADVDDVRVGGSNRDRSGRGDRLIVEDRLPCRVVSTFKWTDEISKTRRSVYGVPRCVP
jgi:hypothetical protein